MPVSVRLDHKTEDAIDRLAKKTGRTKSDVIREAIDLFVRPKSTTRPSKRPYDKIAHLIGVVRGGPSDLSERTGEKFSKLLIERTRK